MLFTFEKIQKSLRKNLKKQEVKKMEKVLQIVQQLEVNWNLELKLKDLKEK